MNLQVPAGDEEMLSSGRTGLVASRASESPWLPVMVLGGSWVVISGVISKVTIIITHIRGLVTPL